MSVETCEIALRNAAAELRPLLEPLGFEFEIEQSAQGHLPFASGFFVRGEIKIGLIYRVDHKLGAVIYENSATNTSHDELLSLLGLSSEQHLRYDERSSESKAVEGDDPLAALRADLSMLAALLNDQALLSRSILAARTKGDQEWRDAIAKQAAKREAWLRRRRGENQ